MNNLSEMKQLDLSLTTPLIQSEDGTVRITGSRVTLDTIVGVFRKGATAEQIMDSFPSLGLREIYGAIAYYLEHTGEVEQYLSERREEADKIRSEIEGRQDTSAFRERIRLRREQLVRS